ncbi:MAG: LysE/ArgO family amino acid transporter [Cognatishimia sp.]|uniref:LysE/ArgO family amino acid transporter n=1 Tax=Cognatishimia sp. TaxID=2211648 RepID=UPI0040599AB0
MTSLFAGFALGLSLILAIGAQNSFVLRQGLKGEFVLPVVLTCAISDAVLIVAGVAGFGALVEAAPVVVDVARWGGAAFLVVYGALNFRSAYRGGGSLESEKGDTPMLAKAIGTVLVLTWANPHVYLDTVVLLGGISAQYQDPRLFGLGAVISSFFFFFSLGYGASLLRGFFASPLSWRILDVGIGITMWAIAYSLISGI